MTLAGLVDRFADLSVLVIGEAMLDSYVGGESGRVCREAPVPIVTVDHCWDAPGAAANTVTALAALGARTTLVSAVGDDAAGETLRRLLEAAGVDCRALVKAADRDTLVKQRISARGQLLLRLDRGSEDAVAPWLERRLSAWLRMAWDDADAVVVSDYGYGVCPDSLRDTVAELQARDPRVLVIDAKDLARWRRAKPTAVKPNYDEATALAGAPPLQRSTARVDQMIDARDAIIAATGATITAVTIDRDGAVILESGCAPYRTYTPPADDSHAAGAGDTFTAALALALAAGAHTANAADLAATAAAACVATPGTTTCTAAMLRDLLAGENKVAGHATVAQRVAAWRSAGKRIVFTNGCFDILHHGHITYLNRAKALGDVLIVGLNADDSVRRLKGPQRPINAQADRAAVLAALGCVDLVAIFEADTPAALIEAIRPDLFVKGGDYTAETLPEAPLVRALGGEVKLLDFLDARSTTSMIDRIRASYGAPPVLG